LLRCMPQSDLVCLSKSRFDACIIAMTTRHGASFAIRRIRQR
jgi:hypothetical protein